MVIIIFNDSFSTFTLEFIIKNFDVYNGSVIIFTSHGLVHFL